MSTIHDFVKRGNLQEVKRLFDEGKHTHQYICGVAARYNQLECLTYLHSKKGYPVTYHTMRDAVLGNSVECLAYSLEVIGGLVRNTQEERELLQLASHFHGCFHFLLQQYPKKDRIKVLCEYLNNTLFEAVCSNLTEWISFPNDKKYLMDYISHMKRYLLSKPNLSTQLRKNAEYSDRVLMQTTTLSENYRHFADIVDTIPTKIEQCSYLVTRM